MQLPIGIWIVYIGFGFCLVESCDRSKLPWEKYKSVNYKQENGVINHIKRQMMTRLYDKLMPLCCNEETFFTEHKNLHIDDIADCGGKVTLQMDLGLTDEAYHKKCREFCYENYIEHIMNKESIQLSSTRTGCLSSEYRPGSIGECDMYFHATDKTDIYYGCHTAELNHAKVFEVKPQCYINYPVASYSISFCSSTTEQCEVKIPIGNKISLICSSSSETGYVIPNQDAWENGHAVMVEEVIYPAEPTSHLTCLTKMAHIFNQQSKFSSYPMELVLDTFELGITACGADYLGMTYLDMKDKYKSTYSMTIKFNCKEIYKIPQDAYSSAARPIAWPTSAEPPDCFEHDKAFDDMADTDLTYCFAYVVETVVSSWMCKANCLAYLFNAYNEKQYTYSDKTCRAVATRKEGIRYKCTLYDWAPDEKLGSMRTGGCLKTFTNLTTLSVIKEMCSEKHYVDPLVEISAIPWIPRNSMKANCGLPLSAFIREEPDTEEGVCQTSRGWPYEYNPDLTGIVGSPYTTRFTSLDIGEHLNAKLRVRYKGNVDRNAFELYCKQQCLNYLHDYFTGKNSKGACRLVATFRYDIGAGNDNPYKCFYKTWYKSQQPFCHNDYEIDNTTEIGAKIEDYQEFRLSYDCFEPKDTEVPQQDDDHEYQSTLSQCRIYLKNVKKLTKRAAECRRLLGIELPDKYTIEWCQQKIEDHRKRKPNLSCIKNCNNMFGSATSKYSKKWCRQIIDEHEEQKPYLSCVKYCRKKHNGLIDGTTNSEANKYGGEYCRKIVANFGKKKPRLSCVQKCNNIHNNLGKYSIEYCKQKKKEFGKSKANLKCLGTCQKLWEREYDY